MALSGKPEPNFEAFKEGSSRQQVEQQLGQPVSEKALGNGQKEVTYKYEMGNSPNGGRATVNFYMDLATLLIAEVFLTPVELAMGHDESSQITYDAQDRVVTIAGYKPPPPSQAEMAARQQQEQARAPKGQQPVGQQPVVATQQQPVVANQPPPVVVAPMAAVPLAGDLDTLPASKVATNPHRHAVVIGIEKYRKKLPPADYAANDARVMADYLNKVLGYPEENIAVLLNDNAAKTDLEKYFEGWLPNRVEKGDSVFIYFSGHGAPNPKTGKAFIVPYDGDPAFVDQTAYPLDRLYDRLGKLPAKEIVVVLDSCFSGSGGRSVIAKGMRPMVLSIENPILSGGKTAVLAASSGDQVSSTYDQYKHGLLTYYVLRGLRGEADSDQNGVVGLSELFGYVKPQVERTARREFNNEQTPQLLGSPEVLSNEIKLMTAPSSKPAK
jgi:hypothetical protein